MEGEQKTITVIRDGIKTKVGYKVTPIDVNCGEATHMPNKMTDKELLEKAAKAAGAVVAQYGISYNAPFWDVSDDSNHKPWNPLTDDGDAMRLAVKLRMDVIHDNSYVMVGDFEICESTYDDDTRAAATRRAITRAAAAMVKE